MGNTAKKRPEPGEPTFEQPTSGVERTERHPDAESFRRAVEATTKSDVDGFKAGTLHAASRLKDAGADAQTLEFMVTFNERAQALLDDFRAVLQDPSKEADQGIFDTTGSDTFMVESDEFSLTERPRSSDEQAESLSSSNPKTFNPPEQAEVLSTSDLETIPPTEAAPPASLEEGGAQYMAGVKIPKGDSGASKLAESSPSPDEDTPTKPSPK